MEKVLLIQVVISVLVLTFLVAWCDVVEYKYTDQNVWSVQQFAGALCIGLLYASANHYKVSFGDYVIGFIILYNLSLGLEISKGYMKGLVRWIWKY